MARRAAGNPGANELTDSSHIPKNILVTGGAGFIGANFVEHILAARPEVTVVNLDALTYAGSRDNLVSVNENPRHVFVHGDITDASLVNELLSRHEIDTIVHRAPEPADQPPHA